MTPTIHLVAAGGGHLELLLHMRAAFEDFERIWVTEPSRRAAALVDEGERVELLAHYGRSPIALAGNARRAAEVVSGTRPRLIVCSGSGLTVPFCLMARASGATIVFTETMARVVNASMSGRVLSRIAGAVLVQWPEMAAVYRGATVCRPALLEGLGAAPAPGRGTFVGSGTWKQPFDRLLRLVDEAAGLGLLPRPVIAQTGVSRYRPRHFTAEAYLSPGDLQARVAGAEVVICHAGSGIISAALRSGRHPLVLPRLKREGEHVDDHQVQIARKLSDYGLATVLDHAITAEDVRSATLALPHALPAVAGPPLVDALRERLEALSGRAPARSGLEAVA